MDTGSTENFLAESHCPSKYVRHLLDPISIKTASGHLLVTKEALVPSDSMSITLKKDPIFRIYEFHPIFSGIFGSTLLRENNAVLDYEKKSLIINNQELPLYFEGDSENEKYIRTADLPELHHLDVLGVSEQLRLDHLNNEENDKIKRLISEFSDIFYHKGDDLSFTNDVKHNIPTGDSGPVYSRAYRYPEIHRDEVNRQIKEMLEQGIITSSSSPYNAPIWIVPNKEWRIVIDYRKLNAVTKEDKYPIPLIDDILDKLGRANYFSTLDLTKGFY